MQDDPRHEYACIVDQQGLVRAFRGRVRRSATAEDFGVGDAIRRAVRVADAVRFGLGFVVDEIGFADRTSAAAHRLLSQVLRDGRRRENVHEHAVAAVPVIAGFVAWFEFDIEEAHVLVLESELVARLLFDGNRLFGRVRDERHETQGKGNQAQLHVIFLPGFEYHHRSRTTFCQKGCAAHSRSIVLIIAVSDFRRASRNPGNSERESGSVNARAARLVQPDCLEEQCPRRKNLAQPCRR